jgi:hypothetical protein
MIRLPARICPTFRSSLQPLAGGIGERLACELFDHRADFATTQLYIDLAGETFRAEQLEERLFGQKLGQK